MQFCFQRLFTVVPFLPERVSECAAGIVSRPIHPTRLIEHRRSKTYRLSGPASYPFRFCFPVAQGADRSNIGSPRRAFKTHGVTNGGRSQPKGCDIEYAMSITWMHWL